MPSTSQDEGTSEHDGSPLHIAKKRRTTVSRRGKMLYDSHASNPSKGRNPVRRLQESAGRTIHEDRAINVPSSRPMEKELVLDLLAFPENVLACILQALPPEQLLNVSRVRLPVPDRPTNISEGASSVSQPLYRPLAWPRPCCVDLRNAASPLSRQNPSRLLIPLAKLTSYRSICWATSRLAMLMTLPQQYDGLLRDAGEQVPC